MSLFVDRLLPTEDAAIQVHAAWHRRLDLLAVAAFSEERGGTVTVLDAQGDAAEAFRIQPHPTAQASCLVWHTHKPILVVAWENGELHVASAANLHKAETLHSDAIHVAAFSSEGSTLITADKSGSVVGWRATTEGAAARLEMLFHHELKDTITCLVFCNSSFGGAAPGASEDVNLNHLARAAVDGDEKALDLFSSWGQSGSSRENLNAYAGSNSGTVYFLSESGSCMEVLQAEGAVKSAFVMEKSLMVIITENLVVGQFYMEKDGNIRELSRVKMSSRTRETHICRVGPHQLAFSSGETNVRVWNDENDDNYVLSQTSGGAKSTNSSEFLTSLDYSPVSKILAGGTNTGYVVMWQYLQRSGGDSELNWKVLPRVHIGTAIRRALWSPVASVILLSTVRQAFLLYEQKRASAFCDEVAAVQVGPAKINVFFPAPKDGKEFMAVTVQTNWPVKKLLLTSANMIAQGERSVRSFEVQRDLQHVMQISEFQCECVDMALFDQNVYALHPDRIAVQSFQGTLKNTLELTDREGSGVSVEVFGKFLLVTTNKSFVKIWDLGKRDARTHVHPIDLKEKIPDFVAITGVSLNETGTFLSVNSSRRTPLSDSKLFVLELEGGAIKSFNFTQGRNDSDEINVLAPPNSAHSTLGSRDSFRENALGDNAQRNNAVFSHTWDKKEPHFMVCETKDDLVKSKSTSASAASQYFVSFFFHEEYGLILHDRHQMGQDCTMLVAVQIPYMYTFSENVALKDDKAFSLQRVVMKDFEGLDASDAATKDAVVKFCFYLSIGNMDEAFRAIKMISNKQVWGNLARMCVKTQRLDVAAICLGKMQHCSGARALRQCQSAKASTDVQVAVLALSLNMPEEAEKNLLSGNQFELLNKFYQDSGKWQQALDIAERLDRIHLRNTYYNYAKHLEAKGDIAGAITYFEKSGTSKFEIPRLLFEDWSALESYVDKSDDKSLKRWLAQYLESTGEMDVALRYYEAAEDYLSLVRVYCYCENLEKAAQIANESGDRAACYHLARQYENIDNIPAAVHFFTKAQAYANAIRICKEQGLDDQIWNLALMAAPNEKLDAAKHFEKASRPQYDKAVILYEKAGYFGKAIDLAMKTNQHNTLQSITKHISDYTDPALLSKTADFFLENSQFEKAVDIFIAGKQVERALELCVQYNIQVTDEMAERLDIDASTETGMDQLQKLAEVCYRQGNYHLATKKWTQAGNRLQAMKALLKSGDTEKIIFFANVSRERDLYIMAANYLQTLDWRNDAEVMRHVILFYQKGKAYDLLGWFYQACASVEIDEYQNYEKAAGALRESVKYLERAEPTPDVRNKMAIASRQAELVARFLSCQKLYESKPGDAMEGLRSLLSVENINENVRKGDIYGLMIEHYVKTQNFRSAQQTMDELRSSLPNANLAYYVSPEALRSLEKALGISLQAA